DAVVLFGAEHGRLAWAAGISTMLSSARTFANLRAATPKWAMVVEAARIRLELTDASPGSPGSAGDGCAGLAPPARPGARGGRRGPAGAPVRRRRLLARPARADVAHPDDRRRDRDRARPRGRRAPRPARRLRARSR